MSEQHRVTVFEEPPASPVRPDRVGAGVVPREVRRLRWPRHRAGCRIAPVVGDRRRGQVPGPDVVRELARAVPAERHERTGVAVYLTVRDLTGRGEEVPADRADAASRADGRQVAGELAHWHAVLGGPDDDHAVQDAATALAWWHVRTHLPGERPPADPAPEEPPGSGFVVRGPLAPPRAPALGAVTAAMVAGRLLRVVNYHSTPRRLAHVVAQEVRDYAERYSVVGPADVDRLLDTGSWGTPRPPVVLAFFDGFANNASVAAPACEQAGVSAWFSLPTGFLDAAPQEQPAFARRCLVRVAPEEVAAGGRLAMTWEDVAALAERHAVGAHTSTHAREAEVTTAEDVRREVVGPLRRVAAVTGRPADSFAWLGGTPYDAGSPAGRAVVDAGVRWFVSGLALERLGRP